MSETTKAVFLSYASQDAEAAKRIADALRAAGVEVWFDAEGGLETGDEWDAKIRRQIKECVLFIAVISANTQAREEGYFRIEWDMAAERARGIASGVAFILPVVVDGTREADALVPDRFRSVQWTKLPGGAVPPDVLARFLKLWSHRTGALKHGAVQELEAGRPRPAERGGGTPSPMKSYALAAVAVLVLGAVLYVALKSKRGPEEKPVTSAPALVSEAQALTRKARALIDDDLMVVRENFRLADEFSRRAVALDATDGEVWATAARISALILRDKYEMTPERGETAKTQVERAGRLAPDSIETGLALATYLEVNKDPQEAEQMLRRLIQRAPADKRLWRSLATNLLNNDRYDDALAVLQQPVGLLEQDPRAQSLLAAALAGLGRYRDEQVVLDRVLQRSPAKMTYYYQLVLLGFYRSDLAAASRFLEKIPPQLMQEDGMINSAAEIWLRLGEGDKALKVLQKSPRDFLEEGFEVRPKGFLTGAALQQAGRPTAALAEWRQALVVVEKRLAGNPNQPLLLYWQAVLQALTGQKAAALETRKLYRELEAKPNAWFDSILLVAVGENEQAIQGLEQAWPTTSVGLRSEIRGELLYGPWLTSIRADPRMQRLIAEQSAAIERDRAGPVAPAKVDDKSIAVLPFANMSEDKDATAFFADGVHEDILTSLVGIRDLRVVSRTSVMDYRGTRKKIPEIGRELHVAYVLEGSVRRAGNKVRVTGQLIKVATDEHVWAKSFDRDLTDIFAIQAELAKAIAGELDAALSPREQKLLAQRPTGNPAAYDLYLKSREIMNRGAAANREELQNRERLLLSAVELDPKFVQAWCELVQAHVGLIAASVDTTPARLAKATAALDRVRALAPEAPEVARALGVYYLFGLHDSVRAAEQFEKLVQLQPNDTESRNWLGTTQMLMGRWSEALTTQRLLTQLDPANLRFRRGLAMTLRVVRRYDEAMAEVSRMKALRPDDQQLDWELTLLSFYATGSTREAEERRERLAASNPDSPEGINGRKRQALYREDYQEYLRLDRLQPDIGGSRGSFDTNVLGALEAAGVYRFLGDMEGARKRLGNLPATLRAQLELEPNNTQYLRSIAQVESILGHHEEALRWIERVAAFVLDSRETRIGMDVSIIRVRILAWAGDKDQAITELARLLRLPSELNVHKMRAEPARWAPLVGDPRFEALLNDPKNNAPLL